MEEHFKKFPKNWKMRGKCDFPTDNSESYLHGHFLSQFLKNGVV
jgi:hypothetical protein